MPPLGVKLISNLTFALPVFFSALRALALATKGSLMTPAAPAVLVWRFTDLPWSRTVPGPPTVTLRTPVPRFLLRPAFLASLKVSKLAVTALGASMVRVQLGPAQAPE